MYQQPMMGQMQPMQQMQQFPFNPFQPERGFLQVSPQNVPFVPQVQTLGDIQNFLPTITAAAINEIQSKASLNPLRMFMFNRYSVNNFQNNDTSILIANICDFLVLQLVVNRNYHSIDYAVQDAVPKVVEMVCGLALQECPALQSTIPPDMAQAVGASIQMFQQVGVEINALKQRGMWPGNQPMQMQMQPMHQMQFGGQQMNTMGIAQVNQRTGFRAGGGQMLGGGGNSQFFNANAGQRPAPVAEVQNEIVSSSVNRWKQAAVPVEQTNQQVLQQPFASRPASVKETQMQPVAQVNQTAEVREELVAYKRGEWNPRADSPAWYLPAFNPFTHELFIKTTSTGAKIPVVKEKEMDQSKHQISTVFGRVLLDHSADTIGKRLREINDYIDKELLEKKAKEAPVNPDAPEVEFTPVVEVSKTWLAQSNLENAWYENVVGSYKAAVNGKRPDIYRNYTQVIDPVICDSDEMDFVRKISRQQSYERVRELLEVVDRKGQISQVMFTQVNRRMTNLINHILRFNMGIPKLAMSSFVDDIHELDDYLNNKYGEALARTLYKDQAENIRREFLLFQPEMIDSMFGGDDGEEKPNFAVNYFGREITQSIINCHISELEVDMEKEICVVLQPELTPILYKVVRSLLDEVKHSKNFSRHYIRTNDGTVLEVSEGYIVPGSIMLSIAHQD